MYSIHSAKVNTCLEYTTLCIAEWYKYIMATRCFSFCLEKIKWQSCPVQVSLVLVVMLLQVFCGSLFCKEHWHFYMCMKDLTLNIPVTALLWSQIISGMCKLSRKFKSFLAILKSLVFRHMQVAFAFPVFCGIWDCTLNSFLNDFVWV